jgi:hypothetical protein
MAISSLFLDFGGFVRLRKLKRRGVTGFSSIGVGEKHVRVAQSAVKKKR